MPNTLTVRGGIGDMLKSIYDTDGSGKVDDSQKLQESTKTQVQDHTPKSHTHAESHITDLDHDAQKVKGVIIDDTAKGDQKVLAYDLASETIVYIEPAPAGAVIESIQFLTATTTGNHTINAVVMLKTILLFSSRSPTAGGTWLPLGYVYLNSSTQVYTYKAYNSIHDIFVVEFASGIKDIQRGQGSIGSGTTIKDQVINQVDLAKAIIINGGGTASTADRDESHITMRFLDSTHIRLQREDTDLGAFQRYEVLEFE